MNEKFKDRISRRVNANKEMLKVHMKELESLRKNVVSHERDIGTNNIRISNLAIFIQEVKDENKSSISFDKFKNIALTDLREDRDYLTILESDFLKELYAQLILKYTIREK